MLAVMLAGCSYTFVEAPPAMPCTASPAAPIADSVIAPGFVAAGIVALATPVTCDHMSTGDCATHRVFDGMLQGIAGVSLIAVAVPFAISAVHGYRATARCRRLRTP